MPKGFIATVLAIALAITGASAIPARADAEDVFGALIGLAIIAGIAAAIDDDDEQAQTNHRRPDRHQYHDRRHQRHHARALPQRCERVFNTRRGAQVGYGRNCINRHAGRLELPRNCLREGRAAGAAPAARSGRRIFYGKRCLRREGYQVTGRRR